MKRIVLLALVASLAPVIAAAQLYKYVDKDGKTVYSDQPPPNVESKQIRIQAAPPAAAPGAPKSALEKDKEAEKARKESRDTSKKAADTAKNDAAQAERCENARNNYNVYNSGTRLQRRLPSGERVYLEEAEIAAEKERARVAMEEACKKS